MAPLQAMEVGKLKKRITDFDGKQIEFRKSFVKMRFFTFKCKKPYDFLSQVRYFPRVDFDLFKKFSLRGMFQRTWNWSLKPGIDV